VVKPEVSLCIQHDKGNNIRDVLEPNTLGAQKEKHWIRLCLTETNT